MRKLSLAIILACSMLMLTSCGGKQNNAKPAENQEEAVINEKTDGTEAQTGETAEPAEADDQSHGFVPSIRKAWASKPLTGVAAGKTASIEHFAAAFCKQYPDYKPNKMLGEYLKAPAKFNEAKNSTEIADERKNGYLSSYIMADLDWGVECCYWKRANGHKLVAFRLTENQMEWDDEERLLAFYDYDPATDTMTPEPALSEKVDETGRQHDFYFVNLPIEGKDIKMICHNTESKHDYASEVHYLFRWNGNDFQPELVKEIKMNKAPSE